MKLPAAVCQELIRAGLDVSKADEQNRLPLELAISTGQDEIVTMLGGRATRPSLMFGREAHMMRKRPCCTLLLLVARRSTAASFWKVVRL